MLSEVVHLARAFVRNDSPEAESCEQHMPERKLFIEAESQRKSDSCAVFARLVSFYCIYDAVLFILIEVWYFVLDLDTAALFAAVS